MITNIILPDILQYVFNLYIDWRNDSKKLIESLNFNFDIKPHKRVDDYFTSELVNLNFIQPLYIKDTYIDDSLIISEEWSNEKRVCTITFENSQILEKILYYRKGRCIYKGYSKPMKMFTPKYKEYYYDDNDKLVVIKNYIFGEKDRGFSGLYIMQGEQVSIYPTGELKSYDFYESDQKHGICHYYNEDEKEYKIKHYVNGIILSEKKYYVHENFKIPKINENENENFEMIKINLKINKNENFEIPKINGNENFEISKINSE
jgi:hypothetical protein